ncbi:hypothetical protein [Micromonospora sp. NPDC005087]|uniref:DUF4760 domain-containing protein n=1 Tax=Micromonospora sp. NPDC005087 TaxID=3364225 RepID=UPI0036A5FBB6
MEQAALAISIIAVALSGLIGWRALTLARHANAVPTLVDLFAEHRGAHLSRARRFVYRELSSFDLTKGLDGLPDEAREMVRELGCFYDNLGALVAHGIVDVHAVSGYLGGSIVPVWEAMLPLVEAERATRTVHYDRERWQAYFQNLYLLVKEQPPGDARMHQSLWRLSR